VKFDDDMGVKFDDYMGVKFDDDMAQNLMMMKWHKI